MSTPEAPPTSLPVRLMQSAGAATFSQVARMVVTFGVHMALRRYISPGEMGVWTWAEPLFVLLSQVRDLGIPAHVARQPRRQWGNYLRILLAWGGCLTLLLALAAPGLALGFAGRDPDTVPILRMLCLFLFVQGLGNLPLVYLDVEQQTLRTIPAELARNLCFAILSLLMAWRGYGVWSLVIAHVVAATLYTAMLWGSCRGEIPLRFERGASWPLVVVSLPLMVLSLLELAVLNLDPLILGLRLPAETVGTAGLALVAVFLVSRQIADASGRVLYPALFRFRLVPADAFDLYTVATVFLTTIVASCAFVFFFNARLISLVLGGERWLAAAAYLQVAAFVPFVRPLTMFGRELLLIYHRDRLLIAYTLVNLLALGGLGLWLTSTRLGALGMAVAGYFPLGQLLLAYGLHVVDPARFWKLLRTLAVVYLIALVCFLPIFLVPADANILRLALSTLAAALSFGLASWRYRHLYVGFLGMTHEPEPTGEQSP
jgi:O-antigen/teichoic acid export membrane protein